MRTQGLEAARRQRCGRRFRRAGWFDGVLSLCGGALVLVIALTQAASAETLSLIRVPNGDARVSLNLRQADVRDAFQILARQGGFNVLLGKDVGGRLSASLDGVTLNQAMTYLAAMSGVSVAPVRDGAAFLVTGVASALNTLTSPAAMRTASLRYRPATEALTHLERTLGKTTLRISADGMANRLILAGDEETIAQAFRALAHFDTPLAQRVYAVKSRDPARLARQIAATFGGARLSADDELIRVAGLTLIPDTRRQTLIAQGNAEQLALIDGWMQAHDRELRVVSFQASFRAMPAERLAKTLSQAQPQGAGVAALTPETLQLVGLQPKNVAASADTAAPLQASALEDTPALISWRAPSRDRRAHDRITAASLEITPSLGLDGALWLTARAEVTSHGQGARSISFAPARLSPGRTLILTLTNQADPRPLTVWITPRILPSAEEAGEDYRKYSVLPLDVKGGKS